MKQICIRLDELLIASLQTAAEKENKNLTEFIREQLQATMIKSPLMPPKMDEIALQKIEFKMLLQVLGLTRFLASRVDEAVVQSVMQESDQLIDDFY